ncbi:rhamnogalacturonan lyase [Pseudopedobacter saltans]|nr:rhamnogalacturonan lyase [Pseudopedobacter saltans]
MKRSKPIVSMSIKGNLYFIGCLLLFVFSGSQALAQRRMEYLTRGIIAMPTAADSVFISWRLLATDALQTAFNIYRKYESGKDEKLNKEPLTKGTNFMDAGVDLNKNVIYSVKPVNKGHEAEAQSYTLKANTPIQQYLEISLRTPPGYTPGDISVGDLDGDGEYELIIHQTGRGADNSQNGITSEPIFQAYKLDGTFLWEINLGKNIREGAHYTQFMVYDLDGDGRAEFVCKTADGTTDAQGKVIGDGAKDWRELDPKSGNLGRILKGPEYLTVFNGLTGEAITTVDYLPGRGNVVDWGHLASGGRTDYNGNRADRFLACIAYLDGKHPSLVMTRGYYARSVLVAWDFKNGKLTKRWEFDTKDSRNPFSGQGYHNLSVADVDGDGKDEIIFGSMVVDDNGKGLFTTGLGHGDALHVGDLDPERPGLEVFGIHELKGGAKGIGAALYDAKNGEILFKGAIDQDVGRGVAENIDPAHKGAYMWWSGSREAYDMKGNIVGPAPRSVNFLIWWDGDLSRELLNSNYIEKYNKGRIFTAEGASSINGSKSTPNLSADIFGDWREELILRTNDNQKLRIYTTTIPTEHRNYTLMHDPQYRLSIAWQNVAYNQPPHTGYYLGTGMGAIKQPNIELIKWKK